MTSYPFTPPSSPPSTSSSFSPSSVTVERPLSANELSYFLPSRANGVNDMYLHHHLTTPTPSLFNQHRIAIIWAILRGRHPLLASHVVRSHSQSGEEEQEWLFRYSPPSTPSQAITLALASLAFPNSSLSSTDLISTYLNGPRLLSPSQLSFLVISPSSTTTTESEFNFLLCTTHFVGDGIALHTLANEFYGLVANGGGCEELEEGLRREMEERRQDGGKDVLPLSTETLLAEKDQSAMVRAASKLALERSQRRAIGSQTLPRSHKSSSKEEVHTIVPTISYPVDQTKRILAKCKKEGVSVSNAVFGLVGVAWARLLESGKVKGRVEEPLLLYSALSLRGLLPPATPPSTPPQSYFHLSLGYYTVTLPSFLPSTSTSTSSSSAIAQTFWHRSRSCKLQTLVHLKSKLLVGKASAEAEQRREKAVKWAKEDDRVEVEKERQVLEAEEMRRREAEVGEEAGGGLFGLGIGLEVGQEQGARFGARYRKEGEDSLVSRMGGMKFDQQHHEEKELPTTSTPPTSPGRVDISTFANADAQAHPPSKPTTTTSNKNITTLPLTPPTTPRAPTQAQTPSLKPTPSSSPPPTTPLLGLSLLGNLDAIYTHASYSPNLTLTALTTGSRQRKGAALLFAYTFQGKLWLSLGWDEAGFGEEGGEVVKGLWEGLGEGVREFLDC